MNRYKNIKNKNQKTPILHFKTQENLNKSLKEWQERLFLNNWIIKAKLVDQKEMDDENQVGKNRFCYSNNSSVIYIMNTEEIEFKNDPVVNCEEASLVHELLHLLYGFMDAPDTYEGTFFEAVEHRKLEMLARSLIMAKYNLKPDWFIKDDQDQRRRE